MKMIAELLIDSWFRNREKSYTDFHAMILDSLMDLVKADDYRPFFVETERLLRLRMATAAGGRLRSYNDFVLALSDHKQMRLN